MLLLLLLLLFALESARALLTIRFDPANASLPELARRYSLDYDVLRKVNGCASTTTTTPRVLLRLSSTWRSTLTTSIRRSNAKSQTLERSGAAWHTDHGAR